MHFLNIKTYSIIVIGCMNKNPMITRFIDFINKDGRPQRLPEEF
jgi:hypothetical protein